MSRIFYLAAPLVEMVKHLADVFLLYAASVVADAGVEHILPSAALLTTECGRYLILTQPLSGVDFMALPEDW